MADHRRNWDHQTRQRLKLSAIRPSQKKKRQAQEESGEIGLPIGPSIETAETPRASPEQEPIDEQMSNPITTLDEASRSLEYLVAGSSATTNPPNQQESDDSDPLEAESNHRRKASRQSSHQSSLSDRSRARLDFAMTPMTPMTSAGPDTPMSPITDVPIDEWSTKISMSWTTPKDDADNRSNNKILSHDWKFQEAHIRAVNRNTDEVLVEVATGWYLFRDSMRIGRAVARSKEEAVMKLREQPPVLAGEPVRLPALNDVDTKTSPAAALETMMATGLAHPAAAAIGADGTQVENIQKSPIVHEQEFTSMDID